MRRSFATALFAGALDPAKRRQADGGRPRVSSGFGRNLALYLGFLLTGVVAVIVGPLLPDLRLRWQLAAGEASLLFVAQFCASAVGAVVSSYRLRFSLVAGYSLIGCGLAGLAFGSWPLAIGAVSLTGFGLGLVLPATNLVIAHQNQGRRGVSLSRLNLVWGLGALLSPLLVAVARLRLPLPALLGSLALLAAVCATVLAARLPDESRDTPTPAGGAARDAGFGRLLLLACLLFLYVGVETSIGGWLVSLIDELGSDRDLVSLVVGSGFWAALLTGRGGAVLLLRRVSEPFLYRLSLALGLAGSLLLVVADLRLGAAAGALVAGLGLGPIFPLTVSRMAAETEASRSRGTGWVFACAGFGGALLPWLTARASEAAGGLRPGLLVPVAGLLVMIGLVAIARASAGSRTEATEPPLLSGEGS